MLSEITELGASTALSSAVKPKNGQKLSLRKLPYWGEQLKPVAKTLEIAKFEWPTEEILAQLPSDVHLKSIVL